MLDCILGPTKETCTDSYTVPRGMWQGLAFKELLVYRGKQSSCRERKQYTEVSSKYQMNVRANFSGIQVRKEEFREFSSSARVIYEGFLED